jgi:hypothetical protein
MEQKLKKNICGLDGCPLLNDVKDLPDLRKAHIGSALEYACRFWTKHLSETPSSGLHVNEVMAMIERFFTKHLLFWIEVLSLTGQLNLGIYALYDIDQWYLSVSLVGYLSKRAFTLCRQGSRANGQITANGLSCRASTDSVTPLPIYTVMSFRFVLLRPGSTSRIPRSPSERSR